MPPGGGAGGADQADSGVRLAPDQEGRVHEMVPRGQLLGDKRLMNRCGPLHCMPGGGGRDYRGQQMRGVRVTGLSRVDHIPGPLCVAFGPKARVGIIRRCERSSARRQLLLGLYLHLALSSALPGLLIVALPGPARRLNHG